MKKRAKPTSKQPEILGHGDLGQLKTAGGQQWPVRVSELDGDVMMLVMLVETDELGDGEIDPPALDSPTLDSSTLDSSTLEATTKYGVARFAGEAVLEESDLVRFRILEEPTVEQRREFVRVQAAQSVVLEVSGSATIDSAFAVDLSGGGMLLSGPETLALGDHIRFRIHLDAEHDPIRGKARVVRCAEDQRALVFEQITKRDRERLIHFIFDRQRAERANTRGSSEERRS
jgi:hypothetical protein